MQSKFTQSVQLDSLESRQLMAATKIMPLGDSITEGYPDAQSYRYDLYQMLAQAGYSVDFVGGQTGNYSKNSVLNNFDQNNEGHSGYRADQIRDNIVSWATANKPDVVLLHAGTNDINSTQDNTETAGEISSIIDNLRRVVPNVKIVLAKIIPGTYNATFYPDLNNKIATLAASKTTTASPITVVDQYSGFDANADTTDGIHPNISGELKMANKWYAALQGILPAPTTPPPGTYLDGLTPTSATNGSGNFEQDRSNGGTGPIDGKTLTLNGATYMRGLGVSASSALIYNIAGGNYTQFNADIGVDDEIASGGGIKFQVYADNVLKYDSGTMTATTATKSISVNITGASMLKLVVADAGGGSATVDHGDWANARVYANGVTIPTAPSGLASTVTGSSIYLSWTDNASNETNFRIERKSGSGAYAKLIDVPANQTSFTDINATPGTAYTYRVFAYNTAGNSGYSNESSATIPLVSGSAYLSDLPYVVVANGYGPAEKDKSNGEAGTGDGTTITLNGTTYAKGLGVHAASDITLNLAGKYSSFSSDVGVDDEVGANGTVVFQILVDGVKKFDSGTMTGSSATKSATVSLAGAQKLELIVGTNDDNYYYDHSDWANAYLTAATGTVPAAPSNLTASYVSTSNGVSLGWADNSSNETGFEIQRKVGSGAWADYALVAANVVSYTDTAVAAATTYSYRVYALGSAGNSTTSNEPSVTTPAAATVPAAPTLATASYVTGSNSVLVGWTDNSGNETGFEVQRKIGSGAWANLAAVAANAVSYSDTTVVAATSYSYRVYAFNSVGNSTTSNEPAITTPAAPSAPAAVTSLTISYTSSTGQVTLAWADNSTNETGFRIERKTGSTGTYAALTSVAANVTSYIDATSLSASTTYFYRVIAFNGVGDAAPSNEQSITTAAPTQPGTTAYLSDLAYVVKQNGWGPAEKDRSNNETGANDGNVLTLNGKTYTKGLGVHAPSDITFNLAGKYSTFTSDIGIDDEVGANGSVVFQILVDGVKVYDSGVMTGNSATQNVSVNTAGKQTLELFVNYVGNSNAYDHGDWANAQLTLTPTTPVPAAASSLAGTFDSVANTIGLTWADNSTSETGFRIERKTGAGVYASLGSVAANVTSFADPTVLEPSKTYTYRVIAFNASGDALPSNEFAFTTPAATVVPVAASGLTATYNINTKIVALSWTDASNNESGFRIEQQIGSGAWTTLTTVGENVTTASDAGPFTVSTNYSYRIVAYNNVGDAASPSNTAAITTPPATIYVSDLTPTSSTNGWGSIEKDMSNGENGTGDGRMLAIRGKTYAKGIGTHSYSKIAYDLAGSYSLFTSDLGIDDETNGNGTVIYTVYVDGVQKYTSGLVTGRDAVKTASVSVAGAQQLWLVVEDSGDGFNFDHADWANAQLSA